MYEPVIKWSGSKRSQAETILTYFPKEIDTYYEPFVGGASVLRRLLNSDIKVNNYICSDINSELIDLWNLIKNNPIAVIKHYKKYWLEMKAIPDVNDKVKYFEGIRNKYNENHNPLDFMFLSRTTINGLIRYNSKGEFNASFNKNRDGIKPVKFTDIIFEWSNTLNEHNVIFKNCSYEDIISNENDFMYLDPPYANTVGLYYGTLDYELFWNYLRNCKCKYLLSFDGYCGKNNYTYNVPTDIYTTHEYLKSGCRSTFKSIHDGDNSELYESLYIK